MSLAAGDALGGYCIVGPLGEGGMARVYRAYQPTLDRYVALKVLPAALGQDPAFRERFRREAQTVAALRHPNILVVYDWGEDAGLAYLVSELVDGGTLADRLGVPLPPIECLRLVRALASALDHAHGRGVVHRDVKPSNVLLHRDGTPVLSDFGVARMMEGSSHLTSVGVLIGTPAYMAPESLEGAGASSAADIYGLGVVLYEMLTGGVPYHAETPAAVLLAHRDGPLPLPRERNPAIAEVVEAVVLKAMARRPQDRFRSGEEMARALEQALSGIALDAEETRVMAAPEAGRGSHRRRRVLLSLLAGVLAVASASAWWLHRSLILPPVAVAAPKPPPHGRLLFELAMSRPASGDVVYAGGAPGARIRFLGEAVQFDAVEPAKGSAVAPFLGFPTFQAGDFVEDVGLQVVSGAGAVGLGFRGGPEGEDVVWLSTNGQLAIDRLHALTPANPSTQPVYLYGPAVPHVAVPASGPMDVALAARGPRIAVYLAGRWVATAQDAQLTSGWFDVRAQPFPGTHFVFRVTRLEVFAPPSSGAQSTRSGAARQ